MSLRHIRDHFVEYKMNLKYSRKYVYTFTPKALVMIKDQVHQSVSVNKIGFKCPGPGQTPCPVAKYKLTEGTQCHEEVSNNSNNINSTGRPGCRAVRVGFYCPANRDPTASVQPPPGVGCCCAVVDWELGTGRK